MPNDTQGVNEVVDLSSSINLAGDNFAVQNTATNVIAIDINADGVFDKAWRETAPNQWQISLDGQTWYDEPNPNSTGYGPYDEIQMLREIFNTTFASTYGILPWAP
jgi:hypothetical protein